MPWNKASGITWKAGIGTARLRISGSKTAAIGSIASAFDSHTGPRSSSANLNFPLSATYGWPSRSVARKWSLYVQKVTLYLSPPMNGASTAPRVL